MTELIAAPSLETFRDLQGTTFTVDDADEPLELELLEVDTRFDVVDDWKQFTLVFDGPADAVLEGGMHRLVDEDGEPFDLTLSPTPVASPAADDVRYEAPLSRHEPGRKAGEGSGERVEEPPVGAPQLSVEPMLGGIELFAGNFAPQSYMPCDGRLLQVQNNAALFSLLGTTYGGDGQVVFNLPDLRGRTPIAAGMNQGGRSYQLGEMGGSAEVSLSTEQLPAHTHAAEANLPVSRSRGNTGTPVGTHLARSEDAEIYTDQPANASTPVDTTVHQAGAGYPHDNMSPYLAITYVIAVQGTWPIRP